MVEEVNTGGLKKFEYSGKVGKLDEERKNDIAKGYEEYGVRKANERKRNIALAIVVVLVLIGLGFWFLK
jgi:hypothetical protein